MADPVDAVPSPLDDEYEQDASSWPTRHLLADTWEENHQIRKNLRLTGKMMVWPKVDLTGVATLQSLSANRLCVGDALCVWATHCPDHAKPPPVEWLKDEVKQLYELLSIEPKPINIYLDAWGVKRSISLCLRRWRAPINNFRDSWIFVIYHTSRNT
ncbi:unnamed protein product [Cladocopium goreaui]|uniref:Uncharacterized protein n=1 Tax=Cladocopium goreaui TaxID=2562237 RepID=A0A9P1G610_9DINO|nr:unnamed protein product [Cladocopium goreaui]